MDLKFEPLFKFGRTKEEEYLICLGIHTIVNVNYETVMCWSVLHRKVKTRDSIEKTPSNETCLHLMDIGCSHSLQ